jgi:hypothetical protein
MSEGERHKQFKSSTYLRKPFKTPTCSQTAAMAGILKLGRRAGYFIKGKDTIQKIVLEATRDSEDAVTDIELLTIAKLTLTPTYLPSIEKTIWKRLTHIGSATIAARKAVEVLDYCVRYGSPQVHPDVLRDGLAILAAASTSRVYHHDRPVLWQAEQNIREKAGATLRFVRNMTFYQQARDSSLEMIERVKYFVFPAAIQELLPASAGPPVPTAIPSTSSVPTLSKPAEKPPSTDSTDSDDELDFDPRARSANRPRIDRAASCNVQMQSSGSSDWDAGFGARAVSHDTLGGGTTSQVSFDMFENPVGMARSASGEMGKGKPAGWNRPQEPQRIRDRGQSNPGTAPFVFE